MNPTNNTPPQPPGLTLGDVLFALFRHKRKIIAISTLGILGAVALYFFGPNPYTSEARLFIKYVVDTKAPAQGAANDAKVRLPDERPGEAAVMTELEIITSLDLAKKTAESLSPDILVKLGGGTNAAKAALIIRSGLVPEVAKRGDVIHVLFNHPNADVVQPVLNQFIATYLERHAEIHHALGIFGDFLNKRTEELKLRLAGIESDLRTAKKNAGIISLEDSKRYDSEQIAKLQQDIRDVDAQLAERQAEATAISRLLPSNALPAASLLLASNLPVATNLAAVPSALPGTNLAAIPQLAPVPPEKLDEYKRISGLLETLRKKEEGYSLELTPENYRLKNVRAQIAANEAAKRKLEDENPGLLAEKGAVLGSDPKSGSTSESNARGSLLSEVVRVAALQARLAVLTNQLGLIRREAASVAEAEGPITQLERQRLLEEGEYSYFQRNLEQLRADEELGANAGRNYSNIIPIQTPTPPSRDPSKLLKAVMMVFFGSLALAFGLALVLEFYLDPTFKRPTEVEGRLRLPLFLSIPRLHLNGKASRLALEAPRVPLLAETNEAAEGSRKPEAASKDPALDASRPGLDAPSSMAPWNPRHQLRPFHDALRDRLTTYFDLKNLTHKPKLVALTSCGEGSGVTTIAAGLAASLSETGEGNVLLVDMNEQGSAHQFFRGKPACGLEDALELQTRDTALVQDKLYLVRENHNGDRLPRSMPKRFQHLVPKLKASDYDYIIFDLPPISQVSVTSKLARYMDISLVVVEAEQTDREVVKRASSFLAQSGANVGVVLNKTRAYGPKRLQQDL